MQTNILPSALLRKLHLTLKPAVTITFDDEPTIIIKKQPRQGWAEAAREAHENEDDQSVISDVFPDEDMEE